MTASVKTPLKVIVQNTQMEKPTIKTPIAKQKLGRENERGCLWAKTPLNGGDEYMTGEFVHNGEKINIVVMRNNYKTHDKMPDWRIYLDSKSNIAISEPNVTEDVYTQDATSL